jgi:hypothetical protein
MAKRSKGLDFEIKRLQRKIQLCELKYQWAIDDGRSIDAERILQKVQNIYGPRLGQLMAASRHQNMMTEKEKTDDAAIHSDNR